MADIRPFKCIRPKKELAGKIAALPYDVYSRDEAEEIVKKDEYTFLNIDRPETHFDKSVDTYDSRVYLKAREILDGMISEGYFINCEEEFYYIYELTMNNRKQTGIVACSSIDDYMNNVIKKHENTRQEKEVDRINHVDICDAQTGPIFLAYRKNDIISEVISKIKQEEAFFDFVSEDEVEHKGWIISSKDDIDKIKKEFTGIKDIYIADGHHRAASAVKVGIKRRNEFPDYKGNEEFNYFLSVLFQDEELMILPYNRVIKDLNGNTKEEFLKKISENFLIEHLKDKQFSPEKKEEIGMFIENEWYKLKFIKKEKIVDPVEKLDVSILQNYILEPILGIKDPRVDKKIDFVGGIRGLNELEKRVRSDMKIAFSMYPTSIEELFEISDAGLLMPPKSTWFEPKLRSGLFIHKLSK